MDSNNTQEVDTCLVKKELFEEETCFSVPGILQSQNVEKTSVKQEPLENESFSPLTVRIFSIFIFGC